MDTSREDELEFSRALSELSEIGNIKDEAALSIGLPYSEKNKRIADFVRNHNLVGNTRAPLAVLVQEGTTVHQLNYLTFTGSDDTAQKFEAQLERGPGHWLHDANRLLLKDIPFDDFELVFDKLYLNWQEEHKYDGQDSVGYYWPLVNYGAWLTKDTILPEDMRPWFHLLALLEKGFCEIGWKFRSSFFETEFGRRLICYLLAENLLEVPEILALKRFRATTQQSSVAFGPSGVGDVIFGTEVYDPGNNYNPATGVFTSTGVFNFSIGVEYTHNGPPGPVVIYIVREPLSGPEEVLAEFRVSTDAPQFFQTNTVALEAENIAIAVGDKISVRAVAFTELIVTGYFQGHAVKAYLDRGMIINPATLIAPELTLLDLLKAAIHLCNGRIETNWEDNEVWVYQPYKTDVFYEEGVEGFFTDAPAVSLSEIVLPDSELVTVERQDKKRYLVIGFADSNDEHVKQKNEGRNTPLYSKIIDRGAQYEEGREYNKNPLFEPTLNKELVKFPLVSPLIVPNNEVDIPHCLDNGNGELSFKIGYRILYCAGYRVQRADNNEIRRWRFQNFGLDNVPYAFQVPGSRLDVAGNGELPRQVLIYGERDIDDLYAMCYRRDLLGKLYSTRSSFQALLNAQEYRTMSFRSLYSLHYGGRTFTARLLEIAGRRTCTGAPAELILRPEAWGGDVCPGKEPPIMAYQRPPCPNYPEIDIAIDVTGNTIIATAQDTAINDPILSDVWVYSDDDGASWQEYTPGTPLSLPAVIFRRFLEFDAEAGTCEKVVTRSAVFETVCDNNPEITLNYDGSKNSITAVGAGAFNSPIASDTWTVEVDGGAPVAYTAGNEISGFTTVKFTRTVSFANNCEDVVAVAEHEVEGDQCNNLPTLDLVEVADCVYEPQVGGTTSSDICLTLIEVSWNAGGKWLPWDGHPVKGAPDTFIRASFMFCDSCPPIHIEKECPFE
ncbi:MAG: hypothetical protein KDD28_15185 [Phaeodactylibacter sp.]|nr:hypothetical protein [Phaeodactylibacter sp.]